MTSISRSFVIAALFCALISTPCAAAGLQLRVDQVSAQAGAPLEVGISFDPGDSDATAVAFYVEYDATRLRFDALAKSGGSLENVRLDVPPEFAASSFYVAGSARIGVAFYDPALPLQALPAARVATLRFQALPGASGFARVRISRTAPVTAADRGGNNLTVSPDGLFDGGVLLVAETAAIHVSATAIDFGSITPGLTVTKNLIVSNDGSAPATVEGSYSGDAQFVPQFAGLQSPLGAGESRVIPISFFAAAPGSSRGSVRLKLDGGDEIHVPLLAVSASGSTAAMLSRHIVPVFSRAAGAESSLWLTALTLHNGATTEATARLTAYDAEGVGGDPLEVTLRVNETRELDDAVQTLTRQTSYRGYLVVEASSPDVLLQAKAVQRLANGSSRRLSLPVIEAARAVRFGESVRLFGLQQHGELRSSIGVLNTGREALALRVTAYDEAGSEAGRREYQVGGGQLAPPLDVLQALSLSERQNVTLAFECLTANCSFLAWSSSTDDAGGLQLQSPR